VAAGPSAATAPPTDAAFNGSGMLSVNHAGAGLSRGQADPGNFGHRFAATVEGANRTSQVVSYPIWFTAAGRIRCGKP
jgi:hypothetical protein